MFIVRLVSNVIFFSLAVSFNVIFYTFPAGQRLICHSACLKLRKMAIKRFIAISLIFGYNGTTLTHVYY